MSKKSSRPHATSRAVSIEFRMPSLGADMAAGKLVEWRIAVGQQVKRGDVVALVETEKGIIDIESFHDGTVEQLVVSPGAEIPVGTVLALFAGEALRASTPMPTAFAQAPPPAAQLGATGPAPTPSPSPQPAKLGPTHRARVSPAARARAHDLGLALESLVGTGPDGVVTLSDVVAAAAHAKPASRPPSLAAPAAQAESPQAAMRRAIANAMARSKREIPHYYLSSTFDFEPTMTWLTRHNATQPVESRLLYIAIVLKAVAIAARDVEGFNGYFRAGHYQRERDVHLGTAISQRGGGLVAPALMDAANKSLADLMRELNDLVTRVRVGRMRSLELSSATITVTSLGDDGADVVQPVIYPDQVAIVGVGAPVTRPWVVDGQVVPRSVITVSLAADHRVSNGRDGARFLSAIRHHLGQPEEL
jgi:pyruvate dehydrogenase E2 component (dihydrolipoamide acetyltransferase)